MEDVGVKLVLDEKAPDLLSATSYSPETQEHQEDRRQDTCME